MVTGAVVAALTLVAAFTYLFVVLHEDNEFNKEMAEIEKMLARDVRMIHLSRSVIKTNWRYNTLHIGDF